MTPRKDGLRLKTDPYLNVLKDCFVATGWTGASVPSSWHCRVVYVLESVGEEGSGGRRPMGIKKEVSMGIREEGSGGDDRWEKRKRLGGLQDELILNAIRCCVT